MRPFLRGALVVVALGALARLPGWVSPPRADAPPSLSRSASPAHAEGPCPPGTLPDGRACVPVPAGPSLAGPSTRRAETSQDRAGAATPAWIPKGPDRPERLDRYALPVAEGLEAVRTGHEPEEHQGIELALARGAEVRAVALRDQVGDAEVLGVSDLDGLILVLLYTTNHPATYLVFLGPLDHVPAVIRPGAELAPGALLGTVAGAERPGLVHLDFEVRKLRQAVDPRAEPLGKLRSSALSLPTDPRNVLLLVP